MKKNQKHFRKIAESSRTIIIFHFPIFSAPIRFLADLGAPSRLINKINHMSEPYEPFQTMKTVLSYSEVSKNSFL